MIPRVSFLLPRCIELTPRLDITVLLVFVVDDGVNDDVFGTGVDIDINYVGIIFMTRVFLVVL